MQSMPQSILSVGETVNEMMTYVEMLIVKYSFGLGSAEDEADGGEARLNKEDMDRVINQLSRYIHIHTQPHTHTYTHSSYYSFHLTIKWIFNVSL